MRATLGHGTGNDFVLLPDPDGDLALTPELVSGLCDRRTGLGADGVLRVVLSAAMPAGTPGVSAASPRWFMDHWNCDGGTSAMCGNGLRVFGRWLVDGQYAAPGRLEIATRSGTRWADVPADPAALVTVGMGPARLPEVTPSVILAGGSRPAMAVDMGNPHLVVAVADVAEAGPLLAAPEFTGAGEFGADGANVEFVAGHPGEPHRLTMRVHERGVGETASCGTGACAAAVASAVRRSEGPGEQWWQVDVPGGRLGVQWGQQEVLLRGPAELVADVEVRDSWLAARRR